MFARQGWPQVLAPPVLFVWPLRRSLESPIGSHVTLNSPSDRSKLSWSPALSRAVAPPPPPLRGANTNHKQQQIKILSSGPLGSKGGVFARRVLLSAKKKTQK